ncbi:PhzF family phenazine biosynthesis protein [Halorarum halobium]|uniref:PhzF family phenazine biosynthesis protein n=1 Tax=Halorarum halobium TaxID=3075121 RepID=UPI0028B11026|nr:PhzF family phenazine biosynthesis protein [Halobaculum sp. XH14]
MTDPDRREACLVDAFTSEPLEGNAAGVLTDAAGLSETQMRAVARELAVSETAFLTPSEAADRKVRYFSPAAEVDLCGHATVAAHARLFETGEIDAGSHTLETNVGVIDVEVTEDGVVRMTQNEPTVVEVDESYERVGEALGCDPNVFRDVGAELPVAYASTGLPFLVVPTNFLEQLGDMDPDPEAVAALADEHDAAGVYAFTFDTLDADATVHGRCFAPGIGILEDPVTGTASGACGAYLDHFAAFTGGSNEISERASGDDPESGTPEEMLFEQGHYVDRPGTVSVRAAGGGPPSIGGDAVTSFTGQLRVPPSDDDDIIEA